MPNCDSCIDQVGGDGFQVGAYPVTIKNDFYTKLKENTKYAGITWPTCGDDQCVIFNSPAEVNDGDYYMDPNAMKCTDKIDDGVTKKCLPDYNYITDFNTQTCNTDNTMVYDGSKVKKINGSTTEELCFGVSPWSSNASCKTEIDNNNGACPWIGYDLFDHGSGDSATKAKVGKYTLNTTNAAEPFWCFTEDKA